MPPDPPPPTGCTVAHSPFTPPPPISPKYYFVPPHPVIQMKLCDYVFIFYCHSEAALTQTVY